MRNGKGVKEMSIISAQVKCFLHHAHVGLHRIKETEGSQYIVAAWNFEAEPLRFSRAVSESVDAGGDAIIESPIGTNTY